MAVDKELYERYKQMKAQGQNITLAELKAQLEQERNQTSLPTSSLPYEEGMNFNASENALKIQEGCTPVKKSVSLVSTPTQSYADNPNKTVAEESVSWAFSPTQTDTENLDANRNEPKKFALIGYPLGHSLSEYIHNAGFKSLGINAKYDILETRPDQLVDRIKYLKTNGYSGFNVTIPLKLPVTMFLDEIDVSADVAHAVNTVKIDPDTKMLKGYNTDSAGFKNAIPNDITLCGKTAGILGTGGAARAAITALAQSQVKEFKLFTRNVANCIEFLEYLRKTFPAIEFNAYQIDRIRDLSDINILVNTTPIGMSGSSVGYTPVEESELITLPSDAVVYDVIYNPKKTNLIKLAQKHNYRTINGVDMFIHQAVEAERIWTGHIPDFKDMKIAALEEL